VVWWIGDNRQGQTNPVTTTGAFGAGVVVADHKPLRKDFLRFSSPKRFYRRCAIGAVGRLALVEKQYKRRLKYLKHLKDMSPNRENG